MNGPALVTVMYDPAQNTRVREIERTRALSHAAKVSHLRRRVRQRAGAGSTKSGNDNLVGNISRIGATSDQVRRADLRRISCQPLTVLSRGNSDPFQSTAISITPEISMLFASWMSHYETNVVSATRKLSDATLRQDMALGNELQMSSVIFACQTLRLVQFSDHKDLQVKALQRKADCLQQLRKVNPLQPGAEIVPFIKALAHMFIAAVLVNEVDEAKLHEAQLRQALTSVQGAQFWTNQDQNLLLSRVYYYDQRCALVYMHAPVLEPDIIDQYWELYPNPILRWLQQRSSGHCIVGMPAFSKGIGEVFRRLQDHIDIVCEGIPELSSKLDEHTISGPVLYSNHLTSMAFSHLELANEQSLIAIDTKARYIWEIEIVLTLAALTFLASAVNGPNIVSLRQRGSRAIRSLQCSLRRIWHDAAHIQDSLFLRYSLLWALYIGAVWESNSGEYDKGKDWFTKCLRENIRGCEIKSWGGLMQITNSFLFVPPRREPGSIWLLGMAEPPGESRCSSCETAISKTLKEVLFSD